MRRFFLTLTTISFSGWSQSAQPTLAVQQHFLPRSLVDWAQVALVVLTAVTLVVLCKYTKETVRLRQATRDQVNISNQLLREAQIQNEAAEKPTLLFGLSSTDFHLGKPLELLEPTIRNIGSGPAFNVVVEPMKGDGVEVQFRLPNVPYLEGKQQLPLKPFITQDGQANGMSSWLSLLADLIRRNNFPADMIVAVQFESISSKTYRSRNRIRYDWMAKLVSTSLIPPIEEL